mmetsp:Transcript_11972/g.17795  ORF Transcript_11972/g.17795 Transcript_11972/m.17795 type:complete len:162 (+) Transcript_11972:18-503(+)
MLKSRSTVLKFRKISNSLKWRGNDRHFLNTNILQQYSTTSANELLTITPEAKNRIIELNKKYSEQSKEIDEENPRFLRIGVGSGGCSGFMAEFEMTTDKQDNDTIIGNYPAQIIVDDLSLEYIKGSTIHFERNIESEKFYIDENPQAESGCSCKLSFDVNV